MTKKRPDFSNYPDLQHYEKDDVLIVMPNTGGRLDRLCRYDERGLNVVYAGWLFADPPESIHVGARNDGYLFLAECRKLGFRVQEAELRIPRSDEVKAIRYDVPDLGTLREFAPHVPDVDHTATHPSYH